MPILFGSVSLPARTRVNEGYLARPDLRGSYPTIVVVSPAWGITSSVTYLCRQVARHGFAVVAPDLYRGDRPSRDVSPEEALARWEKISPRRIEGDLDDTVRFLRSPGTEWSDPDRIGVLGAGIGGHAVVASAPRLGARSVALCYPPLGAGAGTHGRALVELIAEVKVPVLGIFGRDDDTVDLDLLPIARERAPRAEWVLYGGVGHGFLDDDRDGYDPVAAPDAVSRVLHFFRDTLAARPAPAAAG